MAKDVIMPQGLIDLRAELKRMQAVARRHNGGKGYYIVSFDKIADFERRISAMEQEIARLKQEYGSGSAFKGESKSRYSRTEAQINAAKSNIKAWNNLRAKYGTEKAKEISRRRRDLRQVMKNKTFSSTTPHSGASAHDLFKSIMNMFEEGDRDRIRDGYVSGDILDLGESWIEEYDEDEYMDPDIAEELLKDYARILAN